MRLTELEPQFLKFDQQQPDTFAMVESIDGADGVSFLCPVCFAKNNGPVGTHSIICWTPKVPQTVYPTPGRWNLQGHGYDDLSLVAGSSSVLLQGAPCKAHFFVTNGEVRLS
jgi:hypothetical protein